MYRKAIERATRPSRSHARRSRPVLATCVALGLAAAVASGATEPVAAAPTAQRSVIITLRDQVDVQALAQGSRRDRVRNIVQGLRGTADRTQVSLLALLRNEQSRGTVSRFTSLWIVNAIAATATPDLLQAISRRPEVLSIAPDESVFAPAAASVAPPEPNVRLVNAPALWDLGYRGQGVVVASMDTGVDATHPDLLPRWRGGANSWYDPNGQHPNTPTDVSGHGTQTMGVILGGDAGGSAIGVAPDAQWIAVKIFNDRGVATTSGIHLGYQWLLDPDGNPETLDAPDVVNNSWDFSNPGCNLAFQQDLQDLRAAGILPVFAAGNSGPNSSTTVSPANYPEALSVGATDDADSIFPASSRGPSGCGEASSIFPDLVAPGVDVRSSDLYGGYVSSSGTSLAAPHVSGAAALLLSAFPTASPELLISALEGSAVDLGDPGPDNTFGQGRVDALAAFASLDREPEFGLTISPSSASTSPGGRVTYTVSANAANGFDSDVGLSLGGLSPSQGSWTFTPSTIAGGSGSSQLIVTTAASLAPGSYALTITGTGGGLARTASVTLVVKAQLDFALSAMPGLIRTSLGGSATYTVSATPPNGFGPDVKLSLSGLTRSQGSWAFTPATIAGGSGSAQLSVTVAASLPAGSYPLTVTGKGGGLTRTASVMLVVSTAADFAVAVSPSSRSVSSGGTASYTVTVTAKNGFTGTVSFSADGLPPGATASFTRSTLAGSGGSTLTVKTGTAHGTFLLTVRASSGVRLHSASASLTVG